MQFHDINKYIGLCLVRNGQCSIPSLGTFRLKKTYAESTGFGELVPATTTVVFEPINAVDDQFAHFIGMQENISSNNASNMLSKFGKAVKQQVLNGEIYVIDGLGRLIKQGNEISFDVNSSFDTGDFVLTPPNPDKPQEFEHNKITYTTSNEPGGISYVNTDSSGSRADGNNLLKLLVPIGLIGALLAVGYFAYNYLQKSQRKEGVVTTKDTIAQNSTIDSASMPQATGNLPINPPDTARTVAPASTNTVTGDSANAAAPAPVAFKGPAMKVAIQSFATKELAEKKAKFHTGNGNNCTVQQGDSATWLVVINLPSTDKPADKVVDSLRRFFNPKGKVFAVK